MSRLNVDVVGAEKLTAENTDGMMEVTVTYPTPESLELHYRVRNTTDRPIYLCNQLYKTIKRKVSTTELVFEVQPDLVNIQVDTNQVVVSKMVVDVPEWILVEVLQIPCLSRVLPGEEWQEHLTLPLPLMPYTVYDYSPATGPIKEYALCFKLGYFVASPYTESFITKVHTPVGLAYHIDPFPASEQSLWAVGPWTGTVPVVTNA